MHGRVGRGHDRRGDGVVGLVPRRRLDGGVSSVSGVNFPGFLGRAKKSRICSFDGSAKAGGG